MAEVYPYAAMVALWNLPKTIKYKRGSVAENRMGLNTLRTHLSRLSKAEPPLRRSTVLRELLTAELNQLRGGKLTDYEDQLDALFCSYLAYTIHDYTRIITRAHQLARPIKPSDLCSAGSVASVIISCSGKSYTGICLDFASSLGFCAEHAAIAEMLKAHESEISIVVAVDEHGAVLPPCGRCREMMWQLNAVNKDALVILAADRARPLRELLPDR